MGDVAVRSGILGGTFDPPHVAHLALAEAARAALALDRVVFIVAGDPWRKGEQAVSPSEVRLEMTRAAVVGLPWAEVSDLEVRRRGPSYTADTLEELTTGGGDWWFILGADALADMPRWRRPERIVALARLAVARRHGTSIEEALVALEAVVPGVRERVDEVPLPPLEVSATEIRRCVRAQESTDQLLPAAVRQVIEARRLYGAAGVR